MTTRLLDLSGKIDWLVPLLDHITEVAGSLRIPFFVIGATARDLILEHQYGIRSRRGTRDLDLGIQIEDWEKFRTLSEALLSSGKFSKGRNSHTFIYDKLPVDIIPFGKIENEEREIIWAPERETAMSVIGYEDAYENCLIARLRADPIFEVRVASIPGLVMLKLISWKDRGFKDDRDAKDLAFIIENYHQAGNTDCLYEEHFDILKELDYKIAEAGARLLGRDTAAIAKPETREIILNILEEEINKYGQRRLITNMCEPPFSDEQFDKYTILLNEFCKGFSEIPK